MKMKMKLMYAVVLALVTFAFVGCSKDDDNTVPTSGSIDVAVGTYKGKVQVGGNEFFDQMVVVSKVSNERVKVSFSNKSLNVADREFNVSNQSGMFIQGAVGATGGSFLFDIKEKSLLTQFTVMAEGERLVTFTGDKQ
ncbi:hypothetical protein [Sphingobacterium zeae]|uniref:Uncharacterized protein n=1 Tax=Sphingobacterium zeae TaxID=1776859 RepID=A0ABU0U2J2_9SPHI|nr:hypothetical protein [Sphingobacterium zeae]MDQ1149175.1 hypothetical protein [Sphingobacterium zeae]